MKSLRFSAAGMAIVSLAACANAVVTDVPPASDLERLTAHIRTLSSDEMEGRGAGYDGERRAGDYIAAQFAAAGLAPAGRSYFQAFEFRPVGGTEPFQTLPARNVIGFLRGSSRAEEVIVLGAHYDGQGMMGQAAEGRLGEARAGDDRIWNSASDNATSIAALIEIARGLASARTRPARSIMFVAFSGEENRLNGAFAYVRDPPMAWSRHVAMINMEKLVGHEETTLILATDGSSARFATIAGRAAAASGIEVASFYPGIVTDTDHFAFNLAGLPAMVIGTGAYDHVHRNSDEFATLRLAELPRRVAYIEAFVAALAADEASLQMAVDVSPYSGVAGGPATAAELAACGLTSPAFVVTTLGRAAPAERSRLRVGDVIVRVNGQAPAFGEEGANFLEDAFSARGDVAVEIVCNGQRRETRITLAATGD